MVEESSFEPLLDRLRYHERGYTAVEAAIASALIGDPERAVGEPIESFATRVGVSTGSVVRFSRLMGFSGYRALKYGLVARGKPLEQPPATGMAALLERHVRAVQFAVQSIDFATFQLAAEVLSAAAAIDIVGVGASSATARAAEFLLTIAGLRCRRLEDPGEAAAAAGFLGRSGVLVAISHSGRTRATADAARRARESGATVIAVCSGDRSPLANSATHLLLIDAARTRYASDESAFRTAHLALVQVLAQAAGDALDPADLSRRRTTWASARFGLRYEGADQPAQELSPNDNRTLTK